MVSRVRDAFKRLLASRWTYVGGGVITVVLATSMALGGVAGPACSESPGQLANRLGELQKTYAAVYQEASADIQPCQSLDCERPAKLEIAASLRSYNQGLSHVCWRTSDQSLVNALTTANSTAAVAYNSWADAATPADDQVFASAAIRAVASQGAAARRLTSHIQP